MGKGLQTMNPGRGRSPGRGSRRGSRQGPGGSGPRNHPQEQLGNARLVQLMKTGQGEEAVDDLADLTPSQAQWIRTLRDLELLNPSATVADLAMALSLKIWNAGQMWDSNGKSSYPGLILDYQGGDGFKSVRFADPGSGRQVDTGMLKNWATDKRGESSNVNHAFPAVAAQAGRGWLDGEYASFMATSGGDTMQNTAETLMGNPAQWNAGEYAGNLRGETIADQYKETGRPLSVLMLEQFRLENEGG